MLAAANIVGRSRVLTPAAMLMMAPQLARFSTRAAVGVVLANKPITSVMSAAIASSSTMNNRSSLVYQSIRGFADEVASGSTWNADVLKEMKGDVSLKSETNFPTFKHFRLEQFGRVLFIRMDMKDSKVNTLSQEFMQEMVKAIQSIQSNTMDAAVLISSKKDNFIAGADINMLAACKSADEAEALSRGGQQVLDAIASSSVPIVAAINGSCLGGGLEVALACHYRIVTDNPKTALGLPEVMLGLLPGAGGTQRLPKTIGLRKALDLILTGKTVKPKKAVQLKLADLVVPEKFLDEQAINAVAYFVKSTLAKKKPSSLDTKFLEETSFGRSIVFSQATKMVQKQTKGKYPAPPAILEVIKEGTEKGIQAGLAKEAKEFGRLSQTPESKELVNIFFATTALKKNRYGKPQNEIKKIAMLGAGLMGAGITQVSTQKGGYNVVLYDQNQQGIGRGEKQIYNNLKSAIRRKSMNTFERDQILSRVIPATDDTPGFNNLFKDVDLIIEAVPESLELKHKVLSRFEALVPDHCVIASNTSALPIGLIAQGLKRPERVIGMHYFSPVEKMPLLEIITTEKTSKEACAVAVEVGLKQGKTVIVVKDGPGFYTTRILSPMMVEAMRLLQLGVGVEELDKSLRDFGFPVGPVTLMDEVGIDVGKHVASELYQAFGERMGGADSALMDTFLQKGFLGRKTGKGFFLYDEPKKGFVDKLLALVTKPAKKPVNPEAIALVEAATKGVKSNLSKEEIQHRMVFRFVNEAVLCLQEGIIEAPAEGDIGAIFGLGFPPFLGGPFRYIDRIGAQKAVDIMKDLQQKSGGEKCFEPAALLVQHARNGTTFYPKN